MAKNPDISVIVAAYNAEEHVLRAIESALSQECVSVEVIVVDDCSKDATSEIVRSIKDKRVKFVQHEKNQGPGVARNSAIEHASGTWVAVLDADDVYAPGRLARLKAKAEKEGVDIVCDNLLICPEDGSSQRPMFSEAKLKGLTRMGLPEFISGNSGEFEGHTYGYFKPFISMDFLREHDVRYPKDIYIGEDYYFMARLLSKGAVCSIEPWAGYFYSVHDASISHRLSSKDIAKIIYQEDLFAKSDRFDLSTQNALQKRKAFLNELHAYNLLVEAIKARSLKGVWTALKKEPKAALQLSEPIKKRLDQFGKPKVQSEAEGPLVLLFFDGYDLKARDGLKGKVYSYVHHYARLGKRLMFREQTRTGFYTAFQSLVKSLRAQGADVRINDFEAARLHPAHPVGVAGYPSAMEHIDLPNPVVLGPGDFGTPDEIKGVLNDEQLRALIQPSEWFADIYRQVNADKVKVCFFGIDTDRWADTSGLPKEYDFLVYDKIYWDRAQNEKDVLQRVLDDLEQNGHRTQVLKYGEHPQSAFKHALRDCRAMIYLSAHETQGFSVQEALSSNVPVLAWDEGVFMDPQMAQFLPEGAGVTSVPYFDERCGKRFKIEGFEVALAEFMAGMDDFAPRDFVLENLSYEQAARRYLEIYFGDQQGALVQSEAA